MPRKLHFEQGERPASRQYLLRCAIVALAASVLALQAAPARAQQPVAIRIGWQPTTTVEAQIAHVLEKTDILDRNGLRGQFQR